MSMHPHHIMDVEGNDPTHPLASVTPATIDQFVDIMCRGTDGDGRSEPVWVRLRDGTLILGVFPQGDTYLEFSDAGVCDFWPNEERAAA